MRFFLILVIWLHISAIGYGAIGDSLLVGGKYIPLAEAEARLELLPKNIQTKLAISLSRILSEEFPEKSLTYAEVALSNIMSGQSITPGSLSGLPKAQLANIYYLRGKAFSNLGDNNQAINNYFNAIENLEQITTYNDSKFDIYCSLSITYSANQQYKLAEKYLAIADSISRIVSKPQVESQYHLTKAHYFSSIQNTDSANYYLRLIMKTPDNYQFIYIKGKAALRLSILNYSEKQYIRAINYAFQSIHYAQRTRNTNNLVESYITLLSSYTELGRLQDIEKLLAEVDQTINWSRVASLQIYNWELTKSRYYEKSGAHDEALKCLRNAIQQTNIERAFQRNLVSENISRQSEIQQKEKEIEILKLNTQINVQKQLRVRLLQYFFVILFAIIVIAVGVFYRQNRIKTQNQFTILQQREEIAREKLVANINESQLRATQAQLTGQEHERDRIGKELHDGVGGALAGIKLTIEATPYSAVNREFMEMIKNLIHKTTQEVRLISHNLVLPSFQNATLEENIEDLYEDILVKNGIKVSYSAYPSKSWDVFKSNLNRIQLYRIIQEIFTNIYKHSKATEVEMQIVKGDDSLSITVEDNGIGFDISDAQRKGIGIKNIQSRTEFLDGILSIDSSPSGGTFISIEIPLNSK